MYCMVQVSEMNRNPGFCSHATPHILQVITSRLFRSVREARKTSLSLFKHLQKVQLLHVEPAFMFFLLALVLSSIFLRTAYSLHLHRAPGGCTPFHTTFADGSVARRGSHSSESFVSLSPDGSYEVGSGGLQLFMQKPRGKVTKSGGVNDKLADGATVNSTFLISYVTAVFLWKG